MGMPYNSNDQFLSTKWGAGCCGRAAPGHNTPPSLLFEKIPKNLLSSTMDIYIFLTQHAIPYQRVDHPAVYTCEQAERLVPPMPGADTKNLLVRDKKGRRHFLVVVGYDKAVDLKSLAESLGVNGLGFASPERLSKYLGIEPGAVSLLAIVNDTEGAVEVILDKDLWQADVLKCHPLVNTSTLAIRRTDIEKLLTVTGHRWRVLTVPGMK